MKKATPKETSKGKKSTSLVKLDPKQQALTKQKVADLIAADAGAGQESMSREDFAIPRLSILQALSPQCQKRDEAYILGAEPGMILDNISLEALDGLEEGLIIVPVSYRRAYIEWRPRKKGGGFIRDHQGNQDVLSKCTRDPDTNRDVTPEGMEIVTTAEYFVFVVNPETGATKRALISMSSTQLKKARRWNTLINQYTIPNPKGEGTINPAMFYRSYHFTTTPEDNDKGTWMGWVIEPHEDTLELPNGTAIYMEARAFRTAVAAGQVRVSEPVQSDHADTGGSEDTF